MDKNKKGSRRADTKSKSNEATQKQNGRQTVQDSTSGRTEAADVKNCPRDA